MRLLILSNSLMNTFCFHVDLFTVARILVGINPAIDCTKTSLFVKPTIR